MLLDVTVGSSLCRNHHVCMLNHFVGYNARDWFNVCFWKASVFCEGRTSLQRVYASTQVPFGNLNKRVKDRFRFKFHSFCQTYFHEAIFLSLHANGWKSEFYTSWCKWINYFANIVANNAEACVLSVSFNNTPKRSLSIDRHWICLVQNYDLNLWDVTSIRIFGNLSLRKFFNLFSDDSDSTIITCI